MNETIKSLTLPDAIGDRIFSITAGAAIVHTYDAANSWFETSTPKMKMGVLQDADKWKGSITDVSTENDQSVIIEVTTAPGKTEQDCWNALFLAGIDEIIRRQNS